MVCFLIYSICCSCLTLPQKIRPLQDRLLVEVPDESAYLADSSPSENKKPKPIEGKVVAVGKGKALDGGTVQPMEVKEGDTVLFSKV